MTDFVVEFPYTHARGEGTRDFRVWWQRPDGVTVRPCDSMRADRSVCSGRGMIAGPGTYRLGAENHAAGWRSDTPLAFDGSELSLYIRLFREGASLEINQRPPDGLRLEHSRSDPDDRLVLSNGTNRVLTIPAVDGAWAEASCERYSDKLGWIPVFMPIDVRGTLVDTQLQPGGTFPVRVDFPLAVDRLPTGRRHRIAFRIPISQGSEGSIYVQRRWLVAFPIERP